MLFESRNVSIRARRLVILALGIAAVAFTSLGLIACGGGSNQDELNQARKEGANHVHKEERLRGLEKELKHIKKNGGGVTTSPTSSSTTASSSPSSCGGELSVGANTTCPFAENVRDAYFEEIVSGSGTVEAYSPVTGRLYSMYCTASPHECTGGNNASVYFP